MTDQQMEQAIRSLNCKVNNLSADVAAIEAGGVVKTGSSVTLGSDQTSTSTTFADITGLSLPVAANSKYRLTAILQTESLTPAVGGLKVRVAGPAGATFNGHISGNSTTSAAVLTTGVTGFLQTVSAINRYVGTGFAQVLGYVITGATAGVIQLQFSANTAGESNVIHAGSGMDIVALV